MTIVFNNGREISVTQDVAEILNRRILDGSKQWQTFSDIDNGKGVVLMINLSEVSFIWNEKIATVEK